jgi:mannobiose 2-epimerase
MESRLAQEVAAELDGNLRPFWRRHAVDPATGRFTAHMDGDGTVRPDAATGLVLLTRLMWTFAALARRFGDRSDLTLARRAFAELQERFLDRVHGGYVWEVGPDGRVVDGTKRTYGQAFSLYALAELHRACGDAAVLDAAQRLFALLETHVHDPRHLGYHEARAGHWGVTADLRLGAEDLVAPKSMNTHLHLLEAFANLFRVWPDPRVGGRLRELIDLFGRHILELAPGEPRGHLRHFFGVEWEALSDRYTYGHDVEAAWLLGEAAAVLGDAATLELVGRWSVACAAAARAEALDRDGGLAYGGRHGAVVDRARDWWCQAEAVVGFWHVHQLTGEERFAVAAGRVWGFIRRRVVDRRLGEWFWRLLPDGRVDAARPKISAWKGPYHSVRMCLEMLQRLDDRPQGGPA